MDLSSGRRQQVKIAQCDTAFVESDHTTDNKYKKLKCAVLYSTHYSQLCMNCTNNTPFPSTPTLIKLLQASPSCLAEGWGHLQTPILFLIPPPAEHCRRADTGGGGERKRQGRSKIGNGSGRGREGRGEEGRGKGG